MKWMVSGFFAVACCVLINGTIARGLEVQPYVVPPELVGSPVIVSGYLLTGKVLNYVQLYNASDSPVSLKNWALETTTDLNERVRVAVLDGYIAPSNYLIVGRESLNGADFIDIMPSDFGDGSYGELQVVPDDVSGYAVDSIKLTKDGEYRRKTSASTGKYLSTFESVASQVLFGGGFYEYPASTPIVPTEILANPRKCSPLDESQDCKDYVKLYNPSDKPIDLSRYRLRIGYRGQNATASNTFRLDGLLEPGHYVAISESNEGRDVSVANTGGYIWLEDTYGLKVYETTVRSYQDASSSTKEGMAWAFHDDAGVWEWTATPTPWDAPGRFPPPAISTTKISEVQVVCPPGQYRSEETHRCRTLAVQATAKPCPVGQYRNPETNRCRTAVTASTELQPCEPGYERNPDTNRCRKKPEVLGDTEFKTDPTVEANRSFSGWWTLGGLGVLAVGYGVWEWREEIFGATRNLGMFFTSRK